MFASGTRRERLYIDGQWIDSEEYIDVADLAEGGSFAQVAAATDADVENALAAATAAESALRDTTVVQRAQWVTEIAEQIQHRKDELAEVIVREAGKPIASARGRLRLLQSGSDARPRKYARSAVTTLRERPPATKAGKRSSVTNRWGLFSVSLHTITRCRRPHSRLPRHWARGMRWC